MPFPAGFSRTTTVGQKEKASMRIIKISNSYFGGKIKAMQLLLGCFEKQAIHVSWRAGIKRTVKLICHKSIALPLSLWRENVNKVNKYRITMCFQVQIMTLSSWNLKKITFNYSNKNHMGNDWCEPDASWFFLLIFLIRSKRMFHLPGRRGAGWRGSASASSWGYRAWLLTESSCRAEAMRWGDQSGKHMLLSRNDFFCISWSKSPAWRALLKLGN